MVYEYDDPAASRSLVPIATRSPPDNVQFEMADINEPLRYNNGTFDLVHARSISMAVSAISVSPNPEFPIF